MPGAWLFQYALLKGGSVPSCCVTRNWSGVSFALRAFSSSSDSLLDMLSLALRVVAAACFAPGASPAASTRQPVAPSAIANARRMELDMIRTPPSQYDAAG